MNSPAAKSLAQPVEPTAAPKLKWSKTERNLASKGHSSTQDSDENKAKKYMEILQKGTPGVKGILAVHDTDGEELVPYTHQRQSVKLCAVPDCKFHVLAHAAGTGKTATFFQLFAAVELLVGGGARCIIIVPPATLVQWKETAHSWLNLKDKHNAVFATNKEKLVTKSALQKARVVILTRHLLARIFKQSFSFVKQHHKTATGHWASGWIRKQGAALHPLFHEAYDLMGNDEAHQCRNRDTEFCASSRQLACGLPGGDGKTIGGCTKTIGLTATPIMNRPADMAGLCASLNAPSWFCDARNWTIGSQGSTINKDTVNHFKQFINVVKEDILDLPALTETTFDFEPLLEPQDAEQYNEYHASAKRLRIHMEQTRVNRDDLQKFMGLLQRMQQVLVSPRLANIGADVFRASQEEMLKASARDTGALNALFERIRALQLEGHERVMVACSHVTLMQIARKYIARRAIAADAEIGTTFLYDGSLPLPKRQNVRKAFFDAPSNAVMFLSIGAGGVGLHLVPRRGSEKRQYCRACIFWGSTPYSPQQVRQTMKRIHRIGQVHDVVVHHLVARGSVDWAIKRVHKDKAGLESAIIDDDWTSCDVGGNWRMTGTILENCCQMLSDGSLFADVDTLPPPRACRPDSPSSQKKPLLMVNQASIIPGPPIVSQYFRQLPGFQPVAVGQGSAAPLATLTGANVPDAMVASAAAAARTTALEAARMASPSLNSYPAAAAMAAQAYRFGGATLQARAAVGAKRPLPVTAAPPPKRSLPRPARQAQPTLLAHRVIPMPTFASTIPFGIATISPSQTSFPLLAAMQGAMQLPPM